MPGVVPCRGPSAARQAGCSGRATGTVGQSRAGDDLGVVTAHVPPASKPQDSAPRLGRPRSSGATGRTAGPSNPPPQLARGGGNGNAPRTQRPRPRVAASVTARQSQPATTGATPVRASAGRHRSSPSSASTAASPASSASRAHHAGWARAHVCRTASGSPTDSSASPGCGVRCTGERDREQGRGTGESPARGAQAAHTSVPACHLPASSPPSGGSPRTCESRGRARCRMLDAGRLHSASVACARAGSRSACASNATTRSASQAGCRTTVICAASIMRRLVLGSEFRQQGGRSWGADIPVTMHSAPARPRQEASGGHWTAAGS